MTAAQYGHLPAETILLGDRSPLRQSRPSLDDASSDISYRDNLEDEPFDEKGLSSRYSPDEDDGYGETNPMERRRVSERFEMTCFELIQRCQLATTTPEVSKGLGGTHLHRWVRGYCRWTSGCRVLCPGVCCEKGQ